ncbi:MAG: biotin/lipoyl-containing protein, partial [Planctomycetaceae bacterium]|nr:biotin/lipoyl-containing protein [Planctomycetaceae bacterium]
MATAMVMPKWGMTMQEGTVGAWLKSEGDTVEKGEEIVEIESDKAVHLVEAPASGVLARILVAAGDTVAVATPIAVITDEGEEVPADLLIPIADAGSPPASDPTPPSPSPSP